MSKPKYFFTDVFTTQKYGGNQLATFIDCETLTDQDMQNIAREINFSETTFITSRLAKQGGYDVRIFTPKAEVEFAGHPTLGTAHVIRNKLKLTTKDDLVLNLRIGKIPVSFSEVAGKLPVLWMKQMPAKFGKRHTASSLATVLGLEISDIDPGWPIEEVSTGFPLIAIPLKNMDALKRVKINLETYYSLVGGAWAKLILVFCQQGYEPGQSMSVRVFADFYGIKEDAATGSANGGLAAYLAQHEILGSRNIDVLVGQGYEMGRPSTLALRTRDINSELEVYVGGSVVDVAEGVWS